MSVIILVGVALALICIGAGVVMLVYTITDDGFIEDMKTMHEFIFPHKTPYKNPYPEGTETEDITGYTIFSSTDRQTEKGFADRICSNWWTTPTELYCLEKEMSDDQKYHERIVAECGSPMYGGCISERKTQDKLDKIIELLESEDGK